MQFESIPPPRSAAPAPTMTVVLAAANAQTRAQTRAQTAQNSLSRGLSNELSDGALASSTVASDSRLSSSRAASIAASSTALRGHRASRRAAMVLAAIAFAFTQGLLGTGCTSATLTSANASKSVAAVRPVDVEPVWQSGSEVAQTHRTASSFLRHEREANRPGAEPTYNAVLVIGNEVVEACPGLRALKNGSLDVTADEMWLLVLEQLADCMKSGGLRTQTVRLIGDRDQRDVIEQVLFANGVQAGRTTGGQDEGRMEPCFAAFCARQEPQVKIAVLPDR